MVKVTHERGPARATNHQPAVSRRYPQGPHREGSALWTLTPVSRSSGCVLDTLDRTQDHIETEMHTEVRALRDEIRGLRSLLKTRG